MRAGADKTPKTGGIYSFWAFSRCSLSMG